MKISIHLSLMLAAILLAAPIYMSGARVKGAQTAANTSRESTRPVVKDILFIGDSMTGWLSDALNAYGEANGFKVSSIIWDGSTIPKWGQAATRLKALVRENAPDAVFVSLGLNNLAERNPETQLGTPLRSIMEAVGDVPVIWVGPPSWPGKDYGEPYNSWMKSQLGENHYKDNLSLTLPRQSPTNPHPTREGCVKMVDSLVEWLRTSGAVALPGYEEPTTKAIRPKIFIYRKMKESL